MIKQSKIDAYYNAIRYAYLYYNKTKDRRYIRKVYALSNRLHRLEKQYWDSIQKQMDKNKKIIASKRITVPLSDVSVLYQDMVIMSLSDKENLAYFNQYELEVNADIYGTDCPLFHDRQTVQRDRIPEKRKTSLLKRDRVKGQDTRGTLPTGTFKDTSDWLSTLGRVYRKDSPRQTKTRYRTIVRRKSRHGKTLKKRYKISHKDLMLLLGGVIKNVKTSVITKDKNHTFLRIDKFLSVTNYLESISLPQLYNEKIRSVITCKSCGTKKNTLKQYENFLACKACFQINYNLGQYRIRYYYLDNFIRYELNEYKGTIKKQIETENGFKTLFQGNISR
jgi:hypothetical protein